MTINPRDYDLGELEGGETVGRETAAERESNVAPDDIVGSNQYRELMQLEAMTDSLEKPYLDALPDAYAAEVVIFDWLEYLVGIGGFKGALEALRYYRTIGWLTNDIEDILGDYLRSFDDPKRNDPSGLGRADHQLSLVYVAKLAAID